MVLLSFTRIPLMLFCIKTLVPGQSSNATAGTPLSSASAGREPEALGMSKGKRKKKRSGTANH